MTAANTVLMKAQESEQDIANALEEVDQLSKMVTKVPPRFLMKWLFS